MTPEALAQVVILQIKSALAPLQSRIAAIEALQGDLRARIADAETKAATVVVRPEDVALLRDRVVAVETQVVAPTAPAETRDAIEALKKSLEDIGGFIGGLRERVAVVEAKPAPVIPEPEPAKSYDAEVEALRKSFDDVNGRIGDLRERVAVVETRAPVPGPAGMAGKDGRDGVDGVGWDDLIVEHDGERTFTFKSIRGDRVKAHGSFAVPVLMYRGVYTEGKSYEVGDVVTWAGASWHCKKTTSTKPDQGRDFWTLMVKQGRDGKDGKDAPAPIPVVKAG